MATLDVDQMLERFKERAAAVKARGIPPLEQDARRSFIAQAEKDYMDFILVGSAQWEVKDGHLVLSISISDPAG